MTHGVKFLSWRNGRPRWEPSPTARRNGIKGKDLKDENGDWLELGDAITAAVELNRGIGREPLKRPRSQSGYIYFMRAGTAVKIGYSRDPVTRAEAVQIGSPLLISCIIAVRGTMMDERKLHREYASYRLHGEWFKAEQAIISLMMRYAERGARPAPEDKLSISDIPSDHPT